MDWLNWQGFFISKLGDSKTTHKNHYDFNDYLPYSVGTAAIEVDMLLKLILLAWVEVVNLGSLKCHLKFCV